MSAADHGGAWRERALEASCDLLRAECATKDATIQQLHRDLAAARLELVRRARGLILCPDDGPILDTWIEGPQA